MTVLLQDVKYAVRMLRKNPGFTIFAITVLALGIAGNTAIFSIADSVLVRPLPYPDARQLVMVWEDSASYGFPRNTPSPGNFSDWKSRNHVFEDVAATSCGDARVLTGDGNPEVVSVKCVTANFFSLLRIAPVLGRDFGPDDDQPGANRVAIISHGLWLRRFAGAPEVIGKELLVDGQKLTVIGVTPRGFLFQDPEIDLWTPEQFTSEQLSNHGRHFLNVIARLKPGVSLGSANADLAVIAGQLEKEHPDSNAKVGAFAVPLREELAGRTRPGILMLLGAACFVLLIACANVANLLLVRATGRRRELATRLTLGASRSRIVRQMLTESVLLSALAGSLGWILSLWAMRFLTALIPAGISPLGEGGIDRGMLLFTGATSIATGILFGIMPGMRLSRLNLASSLKHGGGQGGIGSAGQKLRSLLVSSEVALAIVLLAGSALMIRSLENLYHLDPGFRADHVMVLRTPVQMKKYDTAGRRAAFYDQILDRVQRLPGFVSAGYTSWIPLTNPGGATGITIEGHPEPAPGYVPIPNARIVSRDYTRALGMKLVEGRLFDERDAGGTQLVALINQTMAQNFWPGENPLGRRFKRGSYRSENPWITIVGIVGDVHQAGLDVPARAEMYLPYQQHEFFPPEYLLVRTAGDPMLLANAVRGEIWAVDKQQPITSVRPFEDLLSQSLAARRLQTWVLGGFGGFALLLASLGIYAVLSYAVAERTQEIGVRVALGAHSSDVLRMVFSHGLKSFAMGTITGLAAALGLSHTLGHLLYGVGPGDPLSFMTVTFVLGLVTLFACYVPARRAMRVDPVVALRYE